MLEKYGRTIPSLVSEMQGFGYSPFVERDNELKAFGTSDYDIRYNVFFLPS